MDIGAVLDLIMKGMSVISTLVSVGENAAPAIKAVTALVTGAKAGTLTPDSLAATEAQLDALIDQFNEPIA